MTALRSSIALTLLLTTPCLAAMSDTDAQRFAYSWGTAIAEDMQVNIGIDHLDLQALGDGMRDVFDHQKLMYDWSMINPVGQQGPDAALDEQHLGYSYGAIMAQKYIRRTEELNEPLGVDIAAFTDGMRDVFEGNELALSREEISVAKEAFETHLVQQAEEQERLLNAESEAFLVRNAQREGVIETDTGFQFEKLESGSGASPNADDRVEMRFKYMNADGTESNTPAITDTLSVNEWGEAFQKILPLMSVGDVWMMYTPAELALSGELQRHRVELLSIE